MKIIQDREMKRINDLIMSTDPEMRSLAIKIISKDEFVRFNMFTIVGFHVLFFLGTLTGIIALSYKIPLGLYWIPLITMLIFQIVGSSIYLAHIVDFRKAYNDR